MIQKVFVALTLVLLFLVQPQMVPTKEYSADRFDQAILVQADGSMLVRETVAFTFVGGPFTYVFRELPTYKTDGITILSASMDERTMPQGSGAGQVEIAYKDPIKVTWHFAPTSDQNHTFVLTYRVLGVVQKTQGADFLNWEALPTRYDYTIRSSTITVSYPEQAVLLDVPEVVRGSAHVATTPNIVIFSTHDLRPNTRLEIGLRFRPGSLIVNAPRWQKLNEQAQALILPYLVGGIMIFVVGSLFLAWLYLRYRRRRSFAYAEAPLITEPPDDLPAAVVGALLSKGPGWNSALATLFDLADRGVLTITQSPEKKWYQAHSDFVIEIQSQQADLRPHERGLLEMLFQTKKGLQSTINVSNMGRAYANRQKRFNDLLKQEMIELGFIDEQQQRVRRSFAIISSILPILASIAIVPCLVFGIPNGVWPIVFLPIGVMAMGVTALVLWGISSPLSDKGMQSAVGWKAFFHYLRDLLREKEPQPSPELFGEYLPYAASFGIADKWVKYFQKRHMDVTIPAWFHALARADDLSYFVMMVVATRAVGHSGGAGGHAGAAGGGASGAG